MKSILLIAALSLSQTGKEATVIFKDGYFVNGVVVEKRDFILDSASGVVYNVPSANGFIYLDDGARRFHFSPTQVQDVVEKKLYADLIKLPRTGPPFVSYRMGPPNWLEKVGEFGNNGDRFLTFNNPSNKPIQVQQRITMLMPTTTRVDAFKYSFTQFYLTRELPYENLRSLLYGWYHDKKDIKDLDKRTMVARFLYQAGYYDQADNELKRLIEDFPDDMPIKELRTSLRKLRTQMFVEDIELANKVGQHGEAKKKLKVYFDDNLAVDTPDRLQLLAGDLKSKYDMGQEKVDKLAGLLKELPETLPFAQRPFWDEVAKVILAELNYDTSGRLDTFMTYAQQYQRDLAEKRTPAQTLEEVLALALTGWLQGNLASEPDVKAARTLWKVRQLLLEHQNQSESVGRSQIVQKIVQEGDLPLETIGRLLKMLPPAQAYPANMITPDSTKIDFSIPDGASGYYHLQLPPDYHHQRSYPVIIALHGVREEPAKLLNRIGSMAARNGYIVAAPMWGIPGKPFYGFSAREHQIVLDCLKDLRRKFQIDSDRVYLFGWEEGGEAVYDIGLGHPGSFAGAVTMCGSPKLFATKYSSNGQYLPYYIVDGERNGGNPRRQREMYKDWLRFHYPSIYVEYKGRMSEWYEAELPSIFEWMNRKKRSNPLKELGAYHTGGGLGEEFRTARVCDNRFYWLGTDSIMERSINDPEDWQGGKPTATLQGSIATGNELTLKSKGEIGSAKIWNQINIRTTGIRAVTVWLAPGMVDFSKPIVFRVNGAQVGNMRTLSPSLQHMLEEVYSTGDRQRLYYLRVDFKI